MKKLGLSRLGITVLIASFMVVGAGMLLLSVMAGRYLDEWMSEEFNISVGEVSLTVYNIGYDDSGATNVNLDGQGPDYTQYESPGYVEFHDLEPGVYELSYMYEGERNDVTIEIVETGGYISASSGLAFGDIHGRAKVLSGSGPAWDSRLEYDKLLQEEFGR